MRTILNIIIFVYCLNFGWLFVGTAFGIDSITDLVSVDFAAEAVRLEDVGNSTGTSATFGVAEIFGDFVTGLNIFWQLISLGPLLSILGALEMPPAFITGMQVICTIFIVTGLMFMITGRGSETSQ